MTDGSSRRRKRGRRPQVDSSQRGNDGRRGELGGVKRIGTSGRGGGRDGESGRVSGSGERQRGKWRKGVWGGEGKGGGERSVREHWRKWLLLLLRKWR